MRPRSKLPVTIIVFSSIVATFALAGIIMDASGVPYTYEATDSECVESVSEWGYSSSDDADCKYTEFESQDWEECCEDTYKQVNKDFTVYSKINSSYTSYYILILIFSVLCIVAASIPMPDYVKTPLITLFGLATATSGVFLARKVSLTAGFYFEDAANSSYQNASTFLHVMPYFGLLVGIMCIALMTTIVDKLNTKLRENNVVNRKLVTSAQTFFSLSLLVFLLSPLVPIAYIPEDEDYEYNDATANEGRYLFPATLLLSDDLYENVDYYDDEDADIQKSIFGNYALVDDLFLTLIWINLSIIMLMSLTLIPKAGFVFEYISQVNILSIVLLVLALIFSIIMYANLPDLVEDGGNYSEERYENLSFHANWFILIASIACIINWVVLLVKNHIPWWKSFGNKKVPISMNNFTQQTAYSNPAQQQFGQQQQYVQQQQYGQQQQYVQQQQFGQQNRGPPRF